MVSRTCRHAAALLALSLAGPAHAEILRNDSAGPGQELVFMGDFRATEWFASTFEIPDELEDWTLCRVLVWLGPAGQNPFVVRLWNEPADVPFNPIDILWDSGDGIFSVQGSQVQVSVLDFRDLFLEFDVRRVRFGFRHTEGWPAPPSIAADTDGITPGHNHINAVVPAIDRQRQAWYVTDELPEGVRPPGDWVIRLEVVGSQQECPRDPVFFPDVGEGEGEVDAGPPPDRDSGPPPQRDAGPPPPRPDVALAGLSVELVVPRTIDDGKNHPIAVFGDGFDADVEVILSCEDCGEGGGPSSTQAFDVELAGSRALHARAPAPDMPLGLYDVSVRRADGDYAVLPMALEVVSEALLTQAPDVVRVVPDQVPAGESTVVVVHGSGFQEGAVVRLDDVALSGTDVLSSDRLQATVSSVVGAGSYDLTVENPDGRASAPVSLHVVDTRTPPSLAAPPQGCDCQVVPRFGRAPRWRLLRLPWLLPLLLAPAGCGPPRADPPPATSLSPSGRRLEVQPGAAESEDLYRSIGAALEAAAPGDVISLAPGDYAEDVVIDRAVTLFGPVDGDAVVAGVGGDATLAVADGVQGVTIARLTVRGPNIGVVLGAGSDTTLSGVLIQRTGGAGVVANEATLRVEGGEISGVGGAGLVAHGGVLTATDLVINDAAEHGVLVDDGGRVTLTRLAVTGASAAGVELRASGGTVSRSVIRDVRESDVTHTGSCIAVVRTQEEVVVRGNHLEGCGLRGVRVYDARALVADNDVVGARLAGISVTNGSTATVQDNRISGSRGAAATAGIGIVVHQSTATVERCTITGSGVAGLQAEAATLVAVGNRIEDSGVRGMSVLLGSVQALGNRVSDNPDFGIFVADVEGPSELSANEVVRTRGAGIVLFQARAPVTLSDNRVRSVADLPSDDFANGDGIVVQGSDVLVVLERNIVEKNAGAGIALVEAVATLRDNSVRHNGATGVSVLSPPATVTLTGNELTANAGAGLLAVGGSTVLEGNTIARTTILASTGQGEGLLFINGATTELLDNTITDSARNGVLLMALSSATMSDNEILGSGRYGVECLGAYADLVKGNVLRDNAQGRTVGCAPRP